MKQQKSLCNYEFQKSGFSKRRRFFKFSKRICKKTVCFFGCAVFFISANVFSLGAGVQFGAGPAFSDLCNRDENRNASADFFGNVAGTIKFFRLPLVLGFGIETTTIKNDFALGFSGFADFHFLNFQIKNNWNFYGGAGISGGILFCFSGEKQIFGSGGLRIFCGAEMILLDNFIELYAQITGNPIIAPNYGANSEKSQKTAICIKTPLEFGIRFHF